jgi:hypothetical protein
MRRSRSRPFLAILIAVIGVALMSPDARADDEETEAAAARAAVYGHLMKSGYLLNRAAAKCYCLGVRQVDDAGAVTIADPPAAAVPSPSAPGTRIETYSHCREACVVLYTGELEWVDDSIAKVRGGFLAIYTHLRLKGPPPRPDARMFTVEEHPGPKWVVIRAEVEAAP